MGENAGIFKECSCCSFVWATRGDFLSDPAINLNGYQICRPELEYGMFLFTHVKQGCNSTFGIKVFSFLDLYSGDRYYEDKSSFPECPGFCMDASSLERCGAQCECAYVLEITHIIKTFRVLNT
jgi:hypothetical protein